MNRITKWISIIERCSLEYRTIAFKDLALNPHYHMFIFYLCNNPGICQDKLSKMLHIDKSNVTRGLKCLKEAGFIYKEVDKTDKRKYHIYPTPKAIEYKPLIIEKIQIWNDLITKNLNEDEKVVLYNLIKKVALNASEESNKIYLEGGD